MLTANGEPAMPPNERLNGGKLDLVIFADQFTLGVSSKRPKAIGTMQRLMILNGIAAAHDPQRHRAFRTIYENGLRVRAWRRRAWPARAALSIRRWRFG